jgi:hypothetical protein
MDPGGAGGGTGTRYEAWPKTPSSLGKVVGQTEEGGAVGNGAVGDGAAGTASR